MFTVVLQQSLVVIKPLPAELFLNRIIHLQFLDLSIIIFWDFMLENLQLVSQLNRVWSDCIGVQVCLALYWWQRLITFSSSKIMAKPMFIAWNKTKKQTQGDNKSSLWANFCSGELKIMARLKIFTRQFVKWWIPIFFCIFI